MRSREGLHKASVNTGHLARGGDAISLREIWFTREAVVYTALLARVEKASRYMR